MPSEPEERVKVWNTYFKFARDAAASLKSLQDRDWEARQHTYSGGTLKNEQMGSLAVAAWCCLAIEARVSHLVEELREGNPSNTLSDDEARAIHLLPTKEKWALLPRLYRILGRVEKGATISFDRSPHQAVAELCALRNNLFHVNYDRLAGGIPPPQKAVKLFNEFVKAMEDMNVLCGRHSKPQRDVLDIALD